MTLYKVKSPILFLIFNRPDETLLVFNEIKKAQPIRLYIAADGPRKHSKDDFELCKQTLKILDLIDWECDVKTLIRNENLGCKIAVSSAITWFFANEEEGIILEDDCLPSTDFFKFCDEMLHFYRDDLKIAHIGGANFQQGIKRNEYSYYFSAFTYVWGWASWRRVWEKYDVNLEDLDYAMSKNFLSFLTNSPLYKHSLETTFKSVKGGAINTWDYQYLFLNVYKKQLAVVPNFNLISNIGFNKNATHTISDSNFANLPFENLEFPIQHPTKKIANKVADNFTLKNITPPFIDIFKSMVKSQLIKSNSFRFFKKKI